MMEKVWIEPVKVGCATFSRTKCEDSEVSIKLDCDYLRNYELEDNLTNAYLDCVTTEAITGLISYLEGIKEILSRGEE